jgi:hypothetical protein
MGSGAAGGLSAMLHANAVIPKDRIAVTLEAQSWELIARVLADAPFRVVAPLIAEIQRQCMRREEEAAPP